MQFSSSGNNFLLKIKVMLSKSWDVSRDETIKLPVKKKKKKVLDVIFSVETFQFAEKSKTFISAFLWIFIFEQ